MAVLLGFVDELITENYLDKVDYTTNKLGGFPDFMVTQNSPKKITCKLCGSVVPLLLQIYAPIKERLQYHRTLYVFACINFNCWGNFQSWICLKKQAIAKEKISNPSHYFSNEDWCSDANNWDECNSNQNSNQDSSSLDVAASLVDRVSVYEENANEVPFDAFTDIQISFPTAEIEPDENEPITLDSPILPNSNLITLLKQKPSTPRICNENIHFIPSFIYAMEEKIGKDSLSDHVLNLLTEYSCSDKNGSKIMNNVNISERSDEKYEKSYPAHGDKLFHIFLSRIKNNPNQVLRYNRSNDAPLFLYAESDIPVKCKYCHGDMVFEMQILPTIINYLQLSNDNQNHGDHLEFGSVFIYTCKESCDKSEEEYVIVQQEKI